MTYLLYDTFLNGPYTLHLLQRQYEEYLPLFAGTKDEAIASEGPFLFRVDETFPGPVGGELHAALEAVVLVRFEGEMAALSAHLGEFIYQTVKGRECYFRFWDGRVLRKFLPTCTREQITRFFGPMAAFTMADEQGRMLEFTHEAGRLLTSLPVAFAGAVRRAPAAPLPAVPEPQPAGVPVPDGDPALPPPRKKRTFLG